VEVISLVISLDLCGLFPVRRKCQNYWKGILKQIEFSLQIYYYRLDILCLLCRYTYSWVTTYSTWVCWLMTFYLPSSRSKHGVKRQF
jgi:hypothetical protein